MRILLKLVVYALAVWLAVQFVDGLEFDGTWIALAGIAVVMALVNAIVKPIVKALSFPLVILTLGVFALIVNALMLQLVVWISRGLDLGLVSTGFGATFFGALVISVVVWLAELIIPDKK